MDAYIHVFGMHLLRHEEFIGGCEATCNGPYGGDWSKTIVGYGSELKLTALELTYNYGISSYAKGNDYRHIALLKTLLPADVIERAKSRGLTVETTSEGTFISMPHDGYKFLVVDAPLVPEQQNPEDPLLHISLHVSNLKHSVEYYRDVLGFTVFRDHSTAANPSVIIGFTTSKSFKIELVQLKHGEVLDHAKAIGRLANEVEDGAPINVEHNVMHSTGGTRERIAHGPFALPPHNEKLIIVRDPDGYELCFVEASGYCTEVGTKTIDWEWREKKLNKK